MELQTPVVAEAAVAVVPLAVVSADVWRPWNWSSAPLVVRLRSPAAAQVLPMCRRRRRRCDGGALAPVRWRRDKSRQEQQRWRGRGMGV